MEQSKPKIILRGRGITRVLDSRVMQSPLAGVTDQIFRSLVRRWAPDSLLFTEMVKATSLELGYGLSKITEITKEEGPIGVQLFDNRPEAMAEAAREAEAAGAYLIDINMGCPVKKIANKGSGSGLLKNPELAAQIVRTITNAVQIPVTVKTRLGWCLNSADPVSFALKLQDAGMQMLTLHARTRQQNFSGKANWNAIRKVKTALSIPVIANGDILSPENASECLLLTKADGVMIGRGAMGAPWLIGQIDCHLKGKPVFKTPQAKERVLLAKYQLKALLKGKGDHGLFIARKHIAWTCRGFPGAKQFCSSIMKTESPVKVLSIIENQLERMNEI